MLNWSHSWVTIWLRLNLSLKVVVRLGYVMDDIELYSDSFTECIELSTNNQRQSIYPNEDGIHESYKLIESSPENGINLHHIKWHEVTTIQWLINKL